MKTITINDEMYGKLAELKRELKARSFSDALDKLMSKDRVSWVYKCSGNFSFDRKRMTEIEWNAWRRK